MTYTFHIAPASKKPQEALSYLVFNKDTCIYTHQTNDPVDYIRTLVGEAGLNKVTVDFITTDLKDIHLKIEDDCGKLPLAPDSFKSTGKVFLDSQNRLSNAAELLAVGDGEVLKSWMLSCIKAVYYPAIPPCGVNLLNDIDGHIFAERLFSDTAPLRIYEFVKLIDAEGHTQSFAKLEIHTEKYGQERYSISYPK